MSDTRHAFLVLVFGSATLSCSAAEPFEPVLGSIEVTVSVAGKHVGQTGVDVRVWAEAAHQIQTSDSGAGRIPLRRIGNTAAFRLAGVEPGDYRVIVSVAPVDDSWPSECVTGGNAADAIVRVHANQVSSLSSAVTCVRLGYIQVRNTSGPAVDPDGYVVYVPHPWWDSNAEGDGYTIRIPPNGSGTIGPLRLKAYDVLIADVAPNCEIGRRTPGAVRVEEGATMEYEFEVRCPQ